MLRALCQAKNTFIIYIVSSEGNAFSKGIYNSLLLISNQKKKKSDYGLICFRANVYEAALKI